MSLVVRRPTTFRLTWTVPAAADGEDVGSLEPTAFEIRSARAPICDENFDSSAATAITAAAAVGKPGDVLSVDIASLYPETQYYFGVAARTGAGAHGPVAAVAAEPARFNLTVLDPPTVMSIDGTADLNGDNLSDLLVGTGLDVLIYFGSRDGYGAPAVHIGPAGTNVLPGMWGSEVLADDVDGDGRPDVVVTGDRVVYVFSLKSHPGGWPPELDSSQADYVIHADPLYTQFAFGSPLARAGDFDGDGHGDLSLSAPLSGDNKAGNVFIVRGGPDFASFTVPDPARAILIHADAQPNHSGFGVGVVALGPYYGSASSTLAIAASPDLFTFVGPALGQDVISTRQRRELLLDRYPGGLAPLGAPPAALMVASPNLNGLGGLVDLFTGAPADGLLSRRRRWKTVETSFAMEDRFKWGGLGTSQTAGGQMIGSWIGDGVPDLMLSHETYAHTWLVLLDGAGLRATPDGETVVTRDVSPGDVTIDRFPEAWGRFGISDYTFIPDCNGDRTEGASATSDFAILFGYYSSSAPHLVVFW